MAVVGARLDLAHLPAQVRQIPRQRQAAVALTSNPARLIPLVIIPPVLMAVLGIRVAVRVAVIAPPQPPLPAVRPGNICATALV